MGPHYGGSTRGEVLFSGWMKMIPKVKFSGSEIEPSGIVRLILKGMEPLSPVEKGNKLPFTVDNPKKFPTLKKGGQGGFSLFKSPRSLWPSPIPVFLFCAFLIIGINGYSLAQPLPPTGIKSLPPTDGQVNLQWDPQTPQVTAYVIFRQLQDTQTPPAPPVPFASIPATW